MNTMTLETVQAIIAAKNEREQTVKAERQAAADAAAERLRQRIASERRSCREELQAWCYLHGLDMALVFDRTNSQYGVRIVRAAVQHLHSLNFGPLRISEVIGMDHTTAYHHINARTVTDPIMPMSVRLELAYKATGINPDQAFRRCEYRGYKGGLNRSPESMKERAHLWSHLYLVAPTLSYLEIGKACGGVAHTTIVTALRQLAEQTQSPASRCEMFDNVRRWMAESDKRLPLPARSRKRATAESLVF